MRTSGDFLLLFLQLLLLHLSNSVQAAVESSQAKPHVVYLGNSISVTFEAAHKAHHNILLNVIDEAQHARDAILYNYRHGFNGFAAILTPAQANSLKELPEVLAVYPSVKHQIHTTRSWDYLGLNALDPNGLWEEAAYGAEIIVGVIDTGIWPESPSFKDKGFSPPPTRWRGECVSGEVPSENFTAMCNNKLIGARYYIKGYEADPDNAASTDLTLARSPRDTDGHGTHTASTIVGRRVQNTSFFGHAGGTVSGGAPHARVAVYKVSDLWSPPTRLGALGLTATIHETDEGHPSQNQVCWTNGCYSADLLAAFDDAIKDGVDIISLSIGELPKRDYSFLSDGIAIGSFHAMTKGILVSASAGNDGPTPGTVANFAPWILTVAANSMDRQFISPISLGAGFSEILGFPLNVYDKIHKFANKTYPLVFGADIPNAGYSPDNSSSCVPGALNATLAQGKIILCFGLESVAKSAILARGSGLISIDDRFGDSSMYALTTAKFLFNESLAGSGVTAAQGQNIHAYMLTSSAPIAHFGESRTTIVSGRVPNIAYFSSRGPSTVVPDILKPDISAPGVDILAAWSAANPIPEYDYQRVQYNLLSGTSMACPHVTATAALIKSRHPTWSPAAIKSALMTTANPWLSTRDGVVDYGAGQVNPARASDPGLILDISAKDYIHFLCAMGASYNSSSLQRITGENVTCSSKRGSVTDLNYPSIAISDFSQPSVIKRTVTNVGRSDSVYTWSLESPVPGAIIRVHPDKLDFKKLGEKKSFTVEILPQHTILGVFGFLIWTDGNYSVRLPISLQPRRPMVLPP